MTLALAAAPPDPVAWKALDTPETPLKPGARFTIRLVGRIQEGWHMYSMRPVADGPIPTRVWIAEGQPVVLAGNIKASTPQNVRDTSFDMEVEQYEGQAEFILPLRVKSSVNDQVLKLPVHASYQTCNNKICLPPKTITIEVPVTITR
jgi:DsbC/DsbD-like thiol-disulfide interchange protein